MKYKTLSHRSLSDLDAEMNAMAEHGWRRDGALAVTIWEGEDQFYQVMVLPPPVGANGSLEFQPTRAEIDDARRINAGLPPKVPVIRGRMWQPKRPPGVIERWRNDGPRGYRFEATNESFDDYEIKDGGLYASGVRKGPADQMQFRVPEDWQRIPSWCRWAVYAEDYTDDRE